MKNESTVKQTLKIFWQFTRPFKLKFWIGTIGAMLGIIFGDILPPLIVSKAFDRLQNVVNNQSALNLAEFLPYVYAYLGVTVVAVIVWRLQVWFVWKYE